MFIVFFTYFYLNGVGLRGLDRPAVTLSLVFVELLLQHIKDCWPTGTPSQVPPHGSSFNRPNHVGSQRYDDSV